MTLVTIPRATVPVAGNAPISAEWYRWAHDITQRVGGPTGAGSNDLALSQFEDAGIEETRAFLFDLKNELRQSPQPADFQTDCDPLAPAAVFLQAVEGLEATVSGLLDQIHQLRVEVEALKQGLYS